MKDRTIIRSLSILGFLPLAGCAGSTYSSHFDCPYGTGAGCSSLSKVNKMIDRNEIDFNEDEPPSEKKKVLIYYGPNQISKIITLDEFSKGDKT